MYLTCVHKYLTLIAEFRGYNTIKCLAKILEQRKYKIGNRMDDNRAVRRVLMAEVSGGRLRGRPRLGWMDGVKVALGNREITVEAARHCKKDRKEWRALVHM